MSVSSQVPRECVNCGAHVDTQQIYCDQCNTAMQMGKGFQGGIDTTNKLKHVDVVHTQG